MNRISAAMALAACLLAAPALAQEREVTPADFTGRDGLVTQCVTFVKDKSWNSIYPKVLEGGGKLAEKSGISHRHLGQAQWGYGSDKYLPVPDDLAMSSPLFLTIYTRGTRKPDSVAIWVSAYTAQDGNRLVVWEDSGIGAGQTRTIVNGMSSGLLDKLEPVIAALAEAANAAQ
jgi:hypothetical protein